jgi:hypothetical protein
VEDSVLTSAAQCSHCELKTHRDYAYCSACSIELAQCQRCKVAILTGGDWLLQLTITLLRWEMRQAIASIESDYINRDAEAKANGAGPDADAKRNASKATKIRIAQYAFQQKVELAQRWGIVSQLFAAVRKQVRSK